MVKQFLLVVNMLDIKRKCVGCNNIKSRNELIKITVNKSLNKIEVNPDSFFVGRSVYICKDSHCVEQAFKKGKIFKILKISYDDTLQEKIRAILAK